MDNSQYNHTIRNIFFIIFLGLTFSGFGQYSNTMYFMKGVPQSNLLNPAFQPACNFYLGLPGMAPLQMNVDNDALRLKDIIYYDKTLDSTITFLHPRGDKEKFLSRFTNQNYFATSLSTSIGSFGFRAGNMYFSFDITEKIGAKFFYPQDLMRIPLYLTLDENGNPYDFDFSGFGINASVYNEMAVGISRKFFESLTIGIRGKLLFGHANLSTANSDITLDTEFDSPWIMNSKMELNASLPFTDIPVDSTGKFDFGNMTFADNPGPKEILDAFLFKPNYGLAMDLGVLFEPFEKMSFSFSILDLGSIRWRNSVYNMKQNAEFTFSGIEMTGLVNRSDTFDIGKALLDSVIQTFDYDPLNNSYTTRLPAHILFGASINLTPKISIGGMTHLEIYQENVRSQIVLSGNIQTGKFFSFSTSYSLANNEYHDLGLGFSFKPGPFNWYLIFDNIPTTFDRELNSNIPIPSYMKGFNMRMGMNLIFGCNKKKKLTKDIPLIE